jgi:thymidylate synthase
MYQFRNVNDAFHTIVEDIHNGEIDAYRVDTRNGGALQVSEPMLWCYTNPWERVLFNEARNANPFFHVYEAMWMLAGEEELLSLPHYCARMATFSDDGVTLNDAYGYRWSYKFGLDQLECLITILKREPETRRAVLAIWHPDDLEDITCDPNIRAVPCNTHVYFRRNSGSLDMTVCNRSNDLLWGAFGANAVHFSFLQEYLCQHLDCNVGVFYTMSNNLHAYEDLWKPEKWLDVSRSEYGKAARLFVEGEHTDEFDREVREFVIHPVEALCTNSFLCQVAQPMVRAWEHHKKRRYLEAFSELNGMLDCDWKRAAWKWLDRAERKWSCDDK